MGEKDGFNLRLIIEKENEDYERSNEVRLDNGTEKNAEENYQMPITEESQISLALTEDESKLLERTRFWSNVAVTARKSFVLKLSLKSLSSRQGIVR